MNAGGPSSDHELGCLTWVIGWVSEPQFSVALAESTNENVRENQIASFVIHAIPI